MTSLFLHGLRLVTKNVIISNNNDRLKTVQYRRKDTCC